MVKNMLFSGQIEDVFGFRFRVQNSLIVTRWFVKLGVLMLRVLGLWTFLCLELVRFVAICKKIG